MNILLHTIALEPARWTPERVSRPLSELLPAIAAAGFYKLEIFEPHLALAPDETILPALFAHFNLAPVVLSSYLDLSPENMEAIFEAEAANLLERVDRHGFKKVRLFPGRSAGGDEEAALRLVADRLGSLADRRPNVEFLVETHDDSLAEGPAMMVRLMEMCGRRNVGLLWQPTIFEQTAARQQLSIQKSHIRHIHLQNRTSDGSFTTLDEGVISWPDLLDLLDSSTDLTIEFIPSGICLPEHFDLTTSLQEAVEEFGWIVKMES